MRPNPLYLCITLLAFLFWLFPLAMGYIPSTKDWDPIFWPAIREAAQGNSPYRVPLATHPIHLYILLVWAALFSAHSSLVLWMGMTLTILLAAAWYLTDREWPALLAIMFCPLLLLLFRMGNVTGVEVAGIVMLLVGLQRDNVLLVGLAVAPLSAIPPNTLPLLAWGLLRKRYFLAGILVGVGMFLGSLALYGNWLPDWIAGMRATQSLMERDYYMDFWRWGWPLMLPILSIMALATYYYRHAFFRLDLLGQALFILASTLMVTPYVLNYRIIPTYVIMVAVLSRRGKYLPLLAMAFGYACLIISLQPGHLYEVVLIIPLAYVVALAELHRVMLAVSWRRHTKLSD